MKKYIQLFQFLLLGVFAFTSCSNEEGDSPDLGGDRVAVQFRSGAISHHTKTTTDNKGATQWESNDAIGVFMINQKKTLLNENIYGEGNNVQYTANIKDGVCSFTTETPLYYPAITTNKVWFASYYPYRENLTGSYPLDMSNQSDESKIDLLYAEAKNEDQGYDNTNTNFVNLEFKHALSMVKVNVVAGKGYTNNDLQGLSIQIGGISTKAALRFSDTVIIDWGDKTSLALNSSGGSNYSCIVIPNQGADDLLVELSNNDRHRWAFPASTTFRAGQKYIYNMTVGRDTIAVSSEIVKWTTIPREGNTQTIAKYQVGDYYPDPNVVYEDKKVVSGTPAIGVVYWIDPTSGGEHGKAVSLVEQMNEDDIPIFHQWSTENKITGATSLDNGRINMAEIAKLNNWSAYPAFEWVHKLNESTVDYSKDAVGVWYLPAVAELEYLLCAVTGNDPETWGDWSGSDDSSNYPSFNQGGTTQLYFSALDEKLETVNGTTFGPIWYCSSSEVNLRDNDLRSVSFKHARQENRHKTHSYLARCVLAF